MIQANLIPGEQSDPSWYLVFGGSGFLRYEETSTSPFAIRLTSEDLVHLRDLLDKGIRTEHGFVA